MVFSCHLLNPPLELLNLCDLQERVSNGLFLALEWLITDEFTAKIKCAHTKHANPW